MFPIVLLECIQIVIDSLYLSQLPSLLPSFLPQQCLASINMNLLSYLGTQNLSNISSQNLYKALATINAYFYKTLSLMSSHNNV